MPDARDWGEPPFVIVYGTLARDHPVVWRELHLLGGYVHALMTARAMAGAPFALPRSVPDEVVAALIADDVLDPHGEGLYLFHGLDRELNGQRHRGVAGGRARAVQAERDPAGRFAPSLDTDAGHSRSDAGPSLDRVAGRPAGTPSLDVQRPSEERREEERYGGVTTSHTPVPDSGITPRATPRARPTPAAAGSPAPAAGGTSPTCRDPEGHAERQRYWVGIGVRCEVCDVGTGDDLGSRFRDRVPRPGSTDD